VSHLDAPLEFGLGGAAFASTTTDAYGRTLAALLPPGKVWRLVAESALSQVLAACGNELARVEVRVGNLLSEVDPSTVSELLPEYERELGLASDGTTAERVARVVARLVAQQRYRPVDIQAALAPLFGLSSGSVVVIERTVAQAAAMGDAREIFRFFVYRNPALGGAYYLASAQALLDKIKPSHTVGHAIESINFLCDDPYSLTDRDILGV
jgi:hypothetical protein